MKPTPVIIKKYGNRRLYDTANSKYVNLEDIAGFIREGRDVQVVDAKTGQDLTRPGEVDDLGEILKQQWREEEDRLREKAKKRAEEAKKKGKAQ